jgi:hypothetical protein
MTEELLAAAIQDAKEAEAYAKELEVENKALTEALRESVATIEDYITYEHDGDPWSEDARAMGEMDINDYATDGRLENAHAALFAARGPK